MKKHMILSGIFISLIFISHNSWALIPPTIMCMSSEDCCAGYTGYCCPTGEYGTAQTCPDGWYLNVSGICARSESNSSDTTGYYTVTYGTCNPTQKQYPCFEKKSVSTQSECMKCQLD